MQLLSKLFCLFVVLFPTFTNASPIEQGQTLPEVSVPQEGHTGEITLVDSAISYAPWTSVGATFQDKVRVVFPMAGRRSAQEINDPLLQAIIAAQFNPAAYQTVVILNFNDIVPGTGFLVRAQAEQNKTKFPYASIVIDGEGAVQQTWELDLQSSAVIVLDETGEVLFFKDGELTAQEVENVITMVKTRVDY